MGIPEAQMYFALCLENGHFPQKSIVDSLPWFVRARQGGVSGADKKEKLAFGKKSLKFCPLEARKYVLT